MPEPPLVFDGLPPGPSFSRTPAPGAVRHRGRVFLFFLREEIQKRQKSLPREGKPRALPHKKRSRLCRFSRWNSSSSSESCLAPALAFGALFWACTQAVMPALVPSTSICASF